MKRLITCLSALSVAIAACGGAVAPSTASQTPPASAEPASPPPADPVTLKYLVGHQDDPELEAAKEAQIAAFNAAHPTIQVTRESLDFAQLQTIIQTRVGAGDVDVFAWSAGPSTGGLLAEAGLVEDMGPAYEKFKWTTFDWARNQCTYGGVLSCMPKEVESIGVYYNKSMFDAKGFKVPTTLDELRTIMDAFKADGVVPISFGNQPQWPGGHMYSMVLSNIVGRAGIDALIDGDAKWNDADAVKAIDIFFRDFVESGYLPKDPNAITPQDAMALFYSGKAAMLAQGTWLIPGVINNSAGKFEASFFPFPSIDGSPIAPPSNAGGATFVAAQSKNKDAAFTFIDWLLSDESIDKWEMPIFNAIPAQPVETTDLELTPLFAQVASTLVEPGTSRMDFGYNLDSVAPKEVVDQLWIGLQEVLNGTITPQQLGDRLQTASEGVSQ